ncbi:MAG TPA: UDP-glucose/GDP-mannose dehydrogenase family protein [Candidatus Binatia bacterium]|jgi:GDP-mannose 6-dehydrogenase
MKISVIGMGYVGSVTAAALSQRGNDVIGVDVNSQKVSAINQGDAPVLEKGLSEIVAERVRSGQLRATTNGAAAVKETDLSLVCVSTPARKNGSFDYSHLLSAVREVGQGIKHKSSGHLVAIRSTLLPGTTENMVIPELEKSSGKKAGADFSVCANPEFLREGSALHDFDNPPFVVIGAAENHNGTLLDKVYEGTEPIFHTSIRTAETLKYICNTFHALKITFANEVGNICQALGVDSHEVMELFCRDTKLNISPAYLKPGFAFGGSCLPKDIRALLYQAKTLDVQAPVLSAILQSNQLQVQRAVDFVLESGAKRVGLLGLTFKPGTDDLRESPLVSLCEGLIGKGFDLSVYDPNLILGNLIGANKAYIEEQVPHIGRLLCDSVDELIAKNELIILGNAYESLRSKLTSLNGTVRVFDLVRFFKEGETHSSSGICW